VALNYKRGFALGIDVCDQIIVVFLTVSVTSEGWTNPGGIN